MNGMLLLALLAATLPTESTTANDTDARPRAFHEINRDIRALMRQEASASTNSERAQAVYEMTRIYTEIRTDPRLPNSDTLGKYKARLWGRLTKVKHDIRKELSRQSRRKGPPEAEVEAEHLDLKTNTLANALSLAGVLNGGPANLLSRAGGSFGGGTIPDYGPDLVALIQRTIVPEFWDVHGGAGTIVYYRPLRVLVVRATDDVHHRIGGVVGGLRVIGK